MSEMRSPTSAVPAWTLGWRLQRALSHAGIGTQEMADEMGVARSTISRWVNDHGAPPRQAFVKQWALRCGVPYEWLSEGVEPQDPTPPTGGLISGEPSSACTRWGQSNVVRLASSVTTPTEAPLAA